MIDSFSFGAMKIDGRQYTSDLIIYPDGSIQDTWWRARGHVLSLADISDLVERKPNTIIAGTGVNGRMRPDAHLHEYLAEQDIAFLVGANDVAVKWYNELKASGNVGACFHLSC
jgi:hypothetical protein